MSIIIEATEDVVQVVRTPVQTSQIQITGQLFDFELEAAVFEVSYGDTVGPDFVPKKQELWVASGPPLVSLMTEPPVGATRVAVLRELSEDAITTIQTTPGLKQTLIDNGHLKIVGGSLRAYFG